MADEHGESAWDVFGAGSEERVRAYEAAAESVRRGDWSDLHATAVASDYESRTIAFWRRAPERRPVAPTGGFGDAAILMLMLALLAVAVWLVVTWWKTAIVAFGASLLAVVSWRWARGRLRVRRIDGAIEVVDTREFLRHCLTTRRCPRCEYDLSALAAALPHVAELGAFIGPRRCPECGLPWPLVPPPVAGPRQGQNSRPLPVSALPPPQV